MAYAPSPRPTFDGPAQIPYAQVTRHLWGESDAGEVADWIYASTDKIHQLVFGLAPGGSFRHSDSFRTIFGADELLYVLEGTMLIANPQTGEVHRVQQGESAFFRRNTWHHAYNGGPDLLRVLEYFAPPPSTGTSGAYAQKQPYLEKSRYTRDELLGTIPMQNAEIRQANTIQVVREADYVWRLEGDPAHNLRPVLVGLMAATDHLTVGKVYLQPGQKTELQSHAGDESICVTQGRLNLHAPDAEGQKWFELYPDDGFYLPQGAPHQYYNMTGAPVEFIFGVAPGYLPDDLPHDKETT
ncbi:MAG: cupin domain-containing protein [Litorilinea sp.]